jgi:hypothetical protein
VERQIIQDPTATAADIMELERTDPAALRAFGEEAQPRAGRPISLAPEEQAAGAELLARAPARDLSLGEALAEEAAAGRGVGRIFRTEGGGYAFAGQRRPRGVRRAGAVAPRTIDTVPTAVTTEEVAGAAPAEEAREAVAAAAARPEERGPRELSTIDLLRKYQLKPSQITQIGRARQLEAQLAARAAERGLEAERIGAAREAAEPQVVTDPQTGRPIAVSGAGQVAALPAQPGRAEVVTDPSTGKALAVVGPGGDVSPVKGGKPIDWGATSNEDLVKLHTQLTRRVDPQEAALYEQFGVELPGATTQQKQLLTALEEQMRQRDILPAAPTPEQAAAELARRRARPAA